MSSRVWALVGAGQRENDGARQSAQSKGDVLHGVLLELDQHVRVPSSSVPALPHVEANPGHYPLAPPGIPADLLRYGKNMQLPQVDTLNSLNTVYRPTGESFHRAHA